MTTKKKSNAKKRLAPAIEPGPSLRPIMSMRKALTDESLLDRLLPGESWAAWRAILIAAMGEPLKADERETFARFSGRPHEPGTRIDELWAVAGRRGGKSRAASVLAIASIAISQSLSARCGGGENKNSDQVGGLYHKVGH